MKSKTVKEPKDEAKPVGTLPFDTDPADKGYVPDGFDTVEEFLQDMREEYDADVRFDEDNREQAIEDKKFAAGEQWDPVVLEHRKGLPCLVINSVPQFTAQLVGDWRESKKGIKVLPAEDGDKDKADVRADLIRAIETQSRADRVYDSTFESAVQCGDGAFRISVEYAKSDVFDQDIFVRPIDDCLSVVWDRLSVDPTGRDARRVFVDDIMSEKDFKKTWPSAKLEEMSTRMYTLMSQDGWIEQDGIRVTEYWRLVERERLLVLFEDGSIRVVTDNLQELIDKHGRVAKTRLAPVTFAQMHLVTGFEILSGPFEYQLNRLPIVRMTGRVVNIAGKRIRYGLVRFMKDSVRLRNFWRSVHAEQLGYAPKAQWLATEGAVEGREDVFRNAHLTRDPLLIYNDDAETPQRVEPAQSQIALESAALINAQDMKDVTGIHDASLGAKSNETSGKAINARQREGDVASITYFDNGNAGVLEAGDIINQLISQIYDGTRIVRVIGEDEKLKFLKINDPSDPESPDLSVGQYDVALSVGASYSTRRAEAAQSMMDAVQVWPALMQVAGDLVAKAQDWPGADDLAERLKLTIPQQFLKPEEKVGPDPQVLQLTQQLQAMAQELQLLKTDKTVEVEKLKIDIYNAETLRIRALSDNMVDATDLEQKAIKHILDSSATVAQGQAQENESNAQRAHEIAMAQGQQTHEAEQQESSQQAAAEQAPAAGASE